MNRTVLNIQVYKCYRRDRGRSKESRGLMHFLISGYITHYLEWIFLGDCPVRLYQWN